MISSLLGTKIGQSQTFTEEGKRIPVTTMRVGPCWITRISEHGSRHNVQLAFGSTKTLSKSLEGHTKKAGLPDKKPRFFREIHVGDLGNLGDLTLGKEITAGAVFQPGDRVSVTGTSKGKGFAGVVKRHGFAGGPRTHGQSDRERAPGSIGQTTTPGRVYRGKRMAGRMGTDRVTVRGLAVVAIDPEKNILTIKGVVPGGRGGLLLITKEG